MGVHYLPLSALATRPGRFEPIACRVRNVCSAPIPGIAIPGIATSALRCSSAQAVSGRSFRASLMSAFHPLRTSANRP